MQTDVRLREAARAIYGACFTSAPIDFDEAERRDTLHHQRAVDAAQRIFASPADVHQCAA